MNLRQQSPFRLLMTRDIYDILDGSTKFEEYELSDGSSITISMPYLSGPALCDISTFFNLPRTYSWKGGSLSRWQYLDELFEHSINTDQCSDLLAYLFDKRQFRDTLSSCSKDEIDDTYTHFIRTIIGKINTLLYFSNNELVVIDNKFKVVEIGSKPEIQAPQIKRIDREYIRSMSIRAKENVEEGRYDSAITQSRTLLEEVFCYVIEKKNEKASKSGSINELYKQVKNLYNMHGDANTDKRINMLLSGLEKIVTSISEMRNNNSDAHGVGANRINIAEHHARLFVNAAIAMADFILSVENRANAT